MVIVDAHCDTLVKIMETGENLYSNSLNLDIERMKKRGEYVQFFASFISQEYCGAYAMKRAIELIDKLYEQCSLYKDDIMLCCNYNDITNALKFNKVAAILSIEGGEALQGSLAALRMFYKLGVRSICLTWNHRNEIADGVAECITGGGLTNFGREVVKEMNKIGMLIDISHISEKGFWDVITLTQQPVILSHSNAKTILNHRRNLTDEQILAVKKNGGVIGINLYPYFLNESGTLSIGDVIRHIEHILSLTGDNHIGMGADFDQMESVFDGIDGVEYIEGIIEELFKLNYPVDTVEKIAGANFLRVIKEVMLN
ncbi:MAG: dipeptidase [Firmicutes bacterium]|nr:dipeptidase [Bacillota bacterium]